MSARIVLYQIKLSSMSLNAKSKDESLSLIEKINSVFLGTRDFKILAQRAVNLMTSELKDEGVVAAIIYRVHTEDKTLRPYAFSSRRYATVNKLFPKRFAELHVPLDEASNLLIKSMLTREEQEGGSLYDFVKPVISEHTAGVIQRVGGGQYGIAYPLRLKQGKVAGVLFFGVSGSEISGRQRMLLEAFRTQFELAFENTIEFERVIERYRRDLAKVPDNAHEENIPTIRFTLRITPKQNALIERKAKDESADKASLIRSLIDNLGLPLREGK